MDSDLKTATGNPRVAIRLKPAAQTARVALEEAGYDLASLFHIFLISEARRLLGPAVTETPYVAEEEEALA